MAFVHGKNTKTLIGAYDLSAYFNNADFPREVDTPEVTTFGDSDREYIVGLRNSNMSLSGFWDSTSSLTPDPVIATTLGATSAKNITYAPNGLTVGNLTYSFRTFYTSYNVTGPVDGVTSLTLDTQNSQGVSRGVSLSNLTARTSDGSATVVNQTNNTSSGGVGYLHLTAISLPATGSLVVAIQDSPTSSAGTWADLIAFTTITSSTVASERATVSGNVDIYVRAEWAYAAVTSGATASSATFAVTFSRS